MAFKVLAAGPLPEVPQSVPAVKSLRGAGQLAQAAMVEVEWLPLDQQVSERDSLARHPQGDTLLRLPCEATTTTGVSIAEAGTLNTQEHGLLPG